jgi:hypothetical protein
VQRPQHTVVPAPGTQRAVVERQLLVGCQQQRHHMVRHLVHAPVGRVRDANATRFCRREIDVIEADRIGDDRAAAVERADHFAADARQPDLRPHHEPRCALRRREQRRNIRALCRVQLIAGRAKDLAFERHRVVLPCVQHHDYFARHRVLFL